MSMSSIWILGKFQVFVSRPVWYYLSLCSLRALRLLVTTFKTMYEVKDVCAVWSRWFATSAIIKPDKSLVLLWSRVEMGGSVSAHYFALLISGSYPDSWLNLPLAASFRLSISHSSICKSKTAKRQSWIYNVEMGRLNPRVRIMPIYGVPNQGYLLGNLRSRLRSNIQIHPKSELSF
jgi:hypothetical protein